MIALPAELEPVLREGVAAGRSIRRIDRRDSPYRTSHALEEVDVILDDGSRVELLLKDLAPSAVDGHAQQGKPRFLASPSREIQAYRTFLAPREVGPTLYAAVDDPTRRRHWLLLERVRGKELYQLGDLHHWEAAARWLGRFHGDLEEGVRVEAPANRSHLLRYDAPLLRRWLSRALDFSGGHRSTTHDRQAILEHFGRHHDFVLGKILAGPSTLVHGEFYASNVLLRDDRQQPEVVPVDWELTGVGPGLLDLAALVAGSWSEEEKREMALIYYHALSDARGEPPESPESFLEALACCRLQIAIQWMGWSRDWEPPDEHRHDWDEEADALVAQLGF